MATDDGNQPGLAAADIELIDVAAQLIATRGREPNHTVAAAARDAAGGIHTGSPRGLERVGVRDLFTHAYVWSDQDA